jgi:hypothetical protein
MGESTVLRVVSSARAARAARAFVLGLAACAAGAGHLLATCGSANCFLNTGTQEGIARPHRLTVDLSYRYIRQDRKRDGSGSTDEVLTPRIDFEDRVVEPDHHREILTQNSLLQVDVAYGASDRLTVALSLPVVNDRDHEHFDDAGTPSEVFSNDAGTSGLGDVRLGVRGSLMVRPKDLLVGGLAVKLPTGSYRLLDDEGEVGEPSIMPGTGSTDGIASLHYSHQWYSARMEGFASGAYRMNSANDLLYRFCDETVVNAGVSRRSGESLTWSVQLNLRHAGRDEYLGDGIDSTGSTYLNLTPGLRFTGAEGLAVYGFVQIPIEQRVNEAQLAPGPGLLLGVSKTF